MTTEQSGLAVQDWLAGWAGDQVGLAGDWHGNTNWASARIMSLADRHGIDLLLHVGDFGIWPGPGGRRYLDGVEAALASRGMRCVITPGNHEDWARLTAGFTARPGLPLALSERVAVLPPGYRFDLAGRAFVSLGGAPSVDRALRVEGESWWPQEAITADDVDRVVAGGAADVMLCHDAPDAPWTTAKVAEICVHNPLGWPAADLRYAAVGRSLVTEAFHAVRPKLFVHGHYHVADQAVVDVVGRPDGCRVVSLSCDGQPGNVAVLELATLAVSD